MLLTLIICQLSVFAAANPFHKYPFVFLLDVGNEELEKTNSEQIRVSVPGGSVALRYPAIGNGDTISHVRVSGIDFGTDLKANIVDGGPGYKYVVFVFIGNKGVPYDAVVTVQTVSDSTAFNGQSVGSVVNSNSNTYQNEEDVNNSAEDLNDTEVGITQSETSIQNSKAELMQSSANMYSYVENESINESDDDDDNGNDDNENDDNDNDNDDSEIPSNESEELSSDDADEKDEYNEVNIEKDIHVPYADDIVKEDNTIQVNGIETEDEDEENDEEETNSNVVGYDYTNGEPIIVDSNLYSKYKILQDHFNLGREVYSQEEFQKNNKPVYQEDPSDYEDTDISGSMYDDEELSNRAEKYKDSNNNYFESADSYAVAY